MLFIEVSFPPNAAVKLRKENKINAIRNTAKNLCLALLKPQINQIAAIRTAIMNITTLTVISNKTIRDIKTFPIFCDNKSDYINENSPTRIRTWVTGYFLSFANI